MSTDIAPEDLRRAEKRSELIGYGRGVIDLARFLRSIAEKVDNTKELIARMNRVVSNVEDTGEPISV